MKRIGFEQAKTRLSQHLDEVGRERRGSSPATAGPQHYSRRPPDEDDVPETVREMLEARDREGRLWAAM